MSSTIVGNTICISRYIVKNPHHVAANEGGIIHDEVRHLFVKAILGDKAIVGDVSDDFYASVNVKVKVFDVLSENRSKGITILTIFSKHERLARNEIPFTIELKGSFQNLSNMVQHHSAGSEIPF
ncbi:hypothetical protein ZIOFF_068626 [Zingiber officinale]|uniref:Uncharacterized protein n=1 Tax=Zingiber officinale TaxID=94328 RepID=A0A8J5BM37_ZINOF|nr:hypothetical protein ZIOFF_068626 [Zingiber officinale]